MGRPIGFPSGAGGAPPALQGPHSAPPRPAIAHAAAQHCMEHALIIDTRASGRVALFRLLATSRERFMEASRALPPGTWRRWLVAIAIGFAMCMGITWLSTWVGERLFDSGALAWETQTIRGLED